MLYSFFNADQIFDFLLSIGMRPFVELSFMPTALSSGDQTVFHYRANVTPPRDYAQWSVLIRKLVGHWVERYGLGEVRRWFFEVWNEPNLTAFGSGKQSDYFELYRYTVEAIKSVDAELQVGGPATAANAWIEDFSDFCHKNQLAVDFISTHHYPTDAFGKPGDDTETQLVGEPAQHPARPGPRGAAARPAIGRSITRNGAPRRTRAIRCTTSPMPRLSSSRRSWRRADWCRATAIGRSRTFSRRTISRRSRFTAGSAC